MSVSARDEVDRAIGHLIAERQHRAEAYGDDFAALWKLAAEHIGGGKLLRPLLLIGAVDALTDRAPTVARTSIIRIAAALEVLHFAFLLHDDVIDGDLRRRHRINLVGAMREAVPHLPEERRDHWAATGGILMGDLMLSLAQRVWSTEPLPDGVRRRLIDLFDEAITESVAGELTDVALADGVTAPTLAVILEMCRRKTGAYTVELPLRVAAALAGWDRATELALGTIGRRLGLAFQVQDDLLSAFGDPREHGKDDSSDLREGKQTAIIAAARETAAWPEIATLFGRADLPPADLARLRELLIDCGARDRVSALVEDELTACARLTDTAPEGIRPLLHDLIARLRGRRV